MTNALKSKLRYYFADGSLTKPASNSPELHVWEKNTSMVIAGFIT